MRVVTVWTRKEPIGFNLVIWADSQNGTLVCLTLVLLRDSYSLKTRTSSWLGTVEDGLHSPWTWHWAPHSGSPWRWLGRSPPPRRRCCRCRATGPNPLCSAPNWPECPGEWIKFGGSNLPMQLILKMQHITLKHWMNTELNLINWVFWRAKFDSLSCRKRNLF